MIATQKIDKISTSSVHTSSVRSGSLKPFFTFYGGKWRAAPHYPKPQYGTIVEPFAGSAGYSLRYPHLDIILIERDPIISVTWSYLINVSEKEILSLPDIRIDQSVDDLDVCEEARLLIGWWLNGGKTRPSKTLGLWGRKSRAFGDGSSGILPWGDTVRNRIASQLQYIRHWQILNTSYESIPPFSATWFIDPPYIKAGKHYRYGSSTIDYDNLADWCLSLEGQIIVCENDGADWLPFEHFRDIKASDAKYGGKKSKESIFMFSTEENI